MPRACLPNTISSSLTAKEARARKGHGSRFFCSLVRFGVPPCPNPDRVRASLSGPFPSDLPLRTRRIVAAVLRECVGPSMKGRMSRTCPSTISSGMPSRPEGGIGVRAGTGRPSPAPAVRSRRPSTTTISGQRSSMRSGPREWVRASPSSASCAEPRPGAPAGTTSFSRKTIRRRWFFGRRPRSTIGTLVSSSLI